MLHAQCPTISNLLNQGYQYSLAQPHAPVSGQSADEIAVFDSSAPFLLKAGLYPPIRSWIIGHCNTQIYYVSFDTEVPVVGPGPIPFIVRENEWHPFTTSFANGNAYQFQVRPPSASRVGHPQDFILTRNGSIHAMSWDSVLKSYPRDSLVRQAAPVASPSFTVQLLGPDSLNYGTTGTVTANVTGGQGAYIFNWQYRELPNGDWIQTVKKQPEFDWIFQGYIHCYFYGDSYKFDVPMNEKDIEVQVLVESYPYPASVDSSFPEIVTANFVITSIPLRITVANEIFGDKTKGTLVVDNDYLNPVPSNSVRPFRYLSSHVLRTNELPFFYNWNGNNGHVKHLYWDVPQNQSVLTYPFDAILTTPTELSAHFLDTKPAAIWSNVDGADVSAGTIELWDPWYYYKDGNNWLQLNNWQAAKTSPLLLDNSTRESYGGVFLGMGTGWEPPYYSLRVPQNQVISINRGGSISSHACNFTGWGALASDAEIKDAGLNSTAVIFKGVNPVVRANYKGTQLSSSGTALTNSGQRKVARTADGTLHQVYESMNSIWYETSTDNGLTWTMMNGGTKLNSQTAKNPAIAYASIAYPYYVAMVFEELEAATGYSALQIVVFRGNGNNYSLWETYTVDSVALYSSGAKPSISFSDGGRIVVVWEKRDAQPETYTAGLHAWGCTINGGTVPPVLHISNTDAGSQNATVEIERGTGTEVIYPFHLAWQQGESSDTYSNIRYCRITYENAQPVNLSEISGSYNVMSQGSGYSKNLYPSIIVYADGEARLSWIGKRIGYYEGVWDSRVIFRGGSNAYFWSFGANADACNINQYPGGYAIAWSQTTADGFTGKLMKNTSFTTYYDLRDEQNAVMTARHLQVNNGADFSSMKAAGLMTGQLPYYFTRSKAVSQISKESTLPAMNSSREGILRAGEALFYYGFGDISVTDAPVGFGDVDESAPMNTIEQLNTCLQSKPFTIADNTPVYYSIEYGVVDSVTAAARLGDEDYINFKTVLTDAGTGTVLMTLENNTVTKANLQRYKNISYEINTTGLGQRLVRLQLQISSAMPLQYSINSKVSQERTLTKQGEVNKVTYKGKEVVTTYALDQNYPNPFNPATTINYQLPKAGIATLKIYDMLGKEVKVLVNEYKESGKYTAEFNGQGLASGVYVYRLDCNGFSATKKLTLLK